MGTSPWWIYDATAGLWKHRDGRSIAPGTGPPPDLPPLYAGHQAFVLRVGMNAVDNKANPLTTPRPQYDEAVGLCGLTLTQMTTRRLFNSGLVTTTALNNMIAEPDATPGQQAVLSFKIPAAGWITILSGAYDAQLLIIRNWAKARIAADKMPVLITFNHEPTGDGPTGNNTTDMGHWGRMQVYCLNYLTGWASRGYGNTGGTYDAANDVREGVVWTSISNGHWWGERAGQPALIAAAYPQYHIDAFTDRGGPMGTDIYDPNLDGGLTVSYDANQDRIENSITFRNNPYNSCHGELSNMLSWARSNGVKCIGFGEMGNVTRTNYDATIDLLMANRDIVTYCCIFNNVQNSKWNWNHVPTNYPAYNGVVNEFLTDYGGDALSAAYITKFQNLVSRSETERDPF